MTPPVVYLDTCTINRLTDDRGQPRLLLEAQAITTIFTLIQSQRVHWIASTHLAEEISRNPNPYKRVFAESLLPPYDQLVLPTEATHATALDFTHQSLSFDDALHLALAIQCQAEAFLTTDDRFLRRTANRTQPPQTINPVDWLRRRHPWLVPPQ